MAHHANRESAIKDSDYVNEENSYDYLEIQEHRYVPLNVGAGNFLQNQGTTSNTKPTVSGETKAASVPPINTTAVPPISTITVRHDNKLKTGDICIRFRQHKISIIAFLIGVILTAIMFVVILVFRSCDEQNDTTYKIDLKFDRSSMYENLFISDDNSVMSNVFTSETSNVVSNSQQLKTYRGAFGNKCFAKTDKMFYKINFSFNLISTLNSTNLVLEVGLVDRQKADAHHHVAGSDGWSYPIHNCVDKICLTAQHYSTKIRTTIKTISFTNNIGTHVKGSLGFFVNMNRNEFSIIDTDTLKVLYTFDQVTGPTELCPVFGLYNAAVLKARLELEYAYDFTNTPIINVIA